MRFYLESETDDGITWFTHRLPVCEHRYLEYDGYPANEGFNYQVESKGKFLERFSVTFSLLATVSRVFGKLFFDSHSVIRNAASMLHTRGSDLIGINTLALSGYYFEQYVAGLRFNCKLLFEEIRLASWSWRKRIVHDIIQLSHTDWPSIFSEITHMSSKRDVVIVFYHGPRNEIEHWNSDEKRTTGFGKCNEEACNNEYIQTVLCGRSEECSADVTSDSIPGPSNKKEKENRKRKREFGIGFELFGCEYTHPHFHMLHDCNWHGQTCRCHRDTTWKRVKSFDAKGEKTDQIGYVVSNLEYSNKGGRFNFFTQIGSSSTAWPASSWYSTGTRRLGYPNTDVPCQGLYELRFEGALQDEFLQFRSSCEPKRRNIQSEPSNREGSPETNAVQGRDRKSKSTSHINKMIFY